MKKQWFTCQTIYRGLREAIETVLQYNEDDKCDLAIKPPDPSALTYEEEDANEDIAACSIPQDVPGTIEVFRNRDDNGSKDSTHNDSDDEKNDESIVKYSPPSVHHPAKQFIRGKPVLLDTKIG